MIKWIKLVWEKIQVKYYGSGRVDAARWLQKRINKSQGTVLIPQGKYLIKSEVNTKNKNIQGVGEVFIITK